MKIFDMFDTVKFNAVKYSPEIKLGFGLLAGVGAIVTAVTATLKIDQVMDEYEEKKKQIEEGPDRYPESYTEMDKQSDKNKLIVRTGFEFAKLYSPTIGLTVLSGFLIVGGFYEMKQRYIAMATAYNALNLTFQKYRKRVREDQGKEKDEQYLYDTKRIEKEEDLGNGKIVKKEYDDCTHGIVNGLSPYSLIWGSKLKGGIENPNWDENRDFNIMFLKAQEATANRMLQTRPSGVVFLNEVYDLIGVPQQKCGVTTGWKRGHGDNYIDFGLWHNERDTVKKYMEGLGDNVFILDFNVDGDIYNLVEE